MVHALEEIWRVLKPGGNLLDLRPIHQTRPLQIVIDQQVIALDTVDYSGQRPDDRAADAALRHVVHDGKFDQQREAIFEYHWYWDTVPEMRTYFDNQDPPILLTEAQIAHCQQQLRVAGAGARLRMQVPMTIGLYAKQQAKLGPGRVVCES
jgi:hypothetical protein